mgnify:CR=1 FL=1
MANPTSRSLSVLHLLKTSRGATWALRQMRELVDSGVTVHGAMPGDGPLVAEYKAAGITVHPVQLDFPVKAPWLLPARLGQLRRLVSEIQPDIIHSHFVGTTLTMRLALGRNHPIPRVFQVPGPLHLEQGLTRSIELWTAGKSDFWIGSCQFTCERYRQAGISTDRIFLAYYGTDLEKFLPGQTGSLRRELQVDDSTPLIGMVAFMYPPKYLLGQTRGLKGHEDLIDALALCLQHNPDLRGVFVGGAWNQADWYEQKVRAYGQKKCGDRVVFLGSRDDVLSLYPDFNLVVHPSHSENVGGAVESLLFAKPTIATNLGGFPDLIKPPQTGWLVPAKQPAQLAAAILEVLANPGQAQARARAGQELAQTLFDSKKTARTVLEIYSKILHPCAVKTARGREQVWT